nr:transcription elongation factor SPT4-like [Salvelinus alpinus]
MAPKVTECATVLNLCGLHGWLALSPNYLYLGHQSRGTQPVYSQQRETTLRHTIDQFEYDGCDNCESYLQMKGNREMVYECTSSSFDGVIAQMSPEDSWVAKWQRISNFKPGVYAVTVTGRLPPGIW